MRRALLVAGMAMALTGALGRAEKVATPEELAQAMRTIASSLEFGAAKISGTAYDEAKPPFVLVRQTLASTVPFWSDRKIDRAATLTKDAVRTLDELDGALSASLVDIGAVGAGLKAVRDACAACHGVYRTGDSQTGYHVKEGVLTP